MSNSCRRVFLKYQALLVFAWFVGVGFCLMCMFKVTGYTVMAVLGPLLVYPISLLQIMSFNRKIFKELTGKFDWWLLNVFACILFLSLGDLFQWDIRAFAGIPCIFICIFCTSSIDSVLGRSKAQRMLIAVIFLVCWLYALFMTASFQLNAVPDVSSRVLIHSSQFTVTTAGMFRARALELILFYTRYLYNTIRHPYRMVILTRHVTTRYEAKVQPMLEVKEKVTAAADPKGETGSEDDGHIV